MFWRAVVGEQVTVYREEQMLPPAPTRLCEVLLCGLLIRQERWLSRANAARQLYPDKRSEIARNALRQTLHRTQQWLGAGAIEATSDHLRLPTPWVVELDQSISSLDIEAEDPWLRELRVKARPTVKTPGKPPHENFIADVTSTSEIDPDEGRALLVAGRNRLWHMQREQALALLEMTKPTRSDAPHTALYLEARGGFEHRIGHLAASRHTNMRALTVAQRQGQAHDARSIAACVLFGLAEAGMSRSAHAWLDHLVSSGAGDLLIQHGVAACAWNEGDLNEALTIYETARPLLQTAGRQERLHYWVNYAVASAEAGQLEKCSLAQEMLTKESINSDDVRILENLSYAKAWAAMHDGDPATAIRWLSAMQPGNWELLALYKVEALALAYGYAGELSTARRHWRKMKQMTAKFGAIQNERRRSIERKLVSIGVG